MADVRFTVILMIVVVVIGKNQAEYDCTKLPPDPEKADTCCNGTNLELEKFKDQCFDGSISEERFRPCDAACVLIASGAFINESFNIPKLKELVEEVTENNTAVVKVFIVGFKICIPRVKKKLQEIDIPISQMKCSPFALLTTFCASIFLFTHCPKREWSDSDICASFREYLINCGLYKFGKEKPHKKSHKRGKGR